MVDQIFPEPTIGIFIFNQTGEMLLLKSHKWPGKYVVPGGHVELGEQLEEAAIRKARRRQGRIFMTRHSGKSGILFSSITSAKPTHLKWNSMMRRRTMFGLSWMRLFICL